MEQSDQPVTKKLTIFTTEDFDLLLRISKEADGCDSLLTYELPYSVSKYLETESDDKEETRSKLNELLSTVSSYHGNDDESWRIKKDVGVPFKVENDILHIGDDIRIADADRIVFACEVRAAFVVPGKKSIALGCKPNLLFRINNLLSRRLFLLDMEGQTDEEGKLQLDLLWKQVAKESQKQEEEAPEQVPVEVVTDSDAS